MRSSFVVEADGVPGLGPASKTVLNSSSPVVKFCYYCNKIVWTKIKHYPTTKTRMIAVVLSPCMLCWVPFFCHWKAELDHHCSDCNAYLGTYNPFFQAKYALLNTFSGAVPVGKKQPQKKYREVGRRYGEYQESSQREEFLRMFNNILQ